MRSDVSVQCDCNLCVENRIAEFNDTSSSLIPQLKVNGPLVFVYVCGKSIVEGNAVTSETIARRRKRDHMIMRDMISFSKQSDSLTVT